MFEDFLFGTNYRASVNFSVPGTNRYVLLTKFLLPKLKTCINLSESFYFSGKRRHRFLLHFLCLSDSNYIALPTAKILKPFPPPPPPSLQLPPKLSFTLPPPPREKTKQQAIFKRLRQIFCFLHCLQGRAVFVQTSGQREAYTAQAEICSIFKTYESMY